MAAYVRDRRGGHWAWFHHAVIDDYGPELGPYGIAVYICLCRHADREEATFVGQKTVAREIGAGRTAVNQAVAKLRALGLVEVEDRQDERGRTTSIYTLLDPPCSPGEQGAPRGEQARPPAAQPLSAPQTDAPLALIHGTRSMEEDVARLAATWSTVLADLREQIVPSNFTRWLARTALSAVDATGAVVACPDTVTAAQLARRYDALLRQALADALGRPVDVRYAPPSDAREAQE